MLRISALIAVSTLLVACAAPNEYNTYEPNKPRKSYNMDWKWWDNHDEDDDVIEASSESLMDDTAPRGRTY